MKVLLLLSALLIQDSLPRKVDKLTKDWKRTEAAEELAIGKERGDTFLKTKTLNPFVISVVARSESEWALLLGEGEFRVVVDKGKILLKQGKTTVHAKRRRFDRSKLHRLTVEGTTGGLKVYLNNDYCFAASFVDSMEGKAGIRHRAGFELKSFDVYAGPRAERPEPKKAKEKKEKRAEDGDFGPLGTWEPIPNRKAPPEPPCGCPEEPPIASDKSIEKAVPLDITVAIRPDAPPQYYEGLKRRFQAGSEELFELTEGQMYIRSMLIRDKSEKGMIVVVRLDGPFLEDGKSIAGQVRWSGNDVVMLLPGDFHPYTFVHEAGHMWLRLPDQYGAKTACGCVMSAGKSMKPFFCDKDHTGEGESCWDRILKAYPNWEHPNDVDGKAPLIQFKVEDK